jgi:hypothetical protein
MPNWHPFFRPIQRINFGFFFVILLTTIVKHRLMKLIICVIVMLISAKECDKKQTPVSDTNATEIASLKSESNMQDQAKVTYQASTRGFFMKIWIEGDAIMISEDNTLNVFETYPFPTEEKEAFLQLLNDTDTATLPELEGPSKTFQYDAAAMAWLEISDGEDSYKTMIFDHGKPPEAIQDLVEKILSLKTMVEKQ